MMMMMMMMIMIVVVVMVKVMWCFWWVKSLTEHQELEPSGLVSISGLIAMENGQFIDGLPIKNGDFPWLC